MEILTKSSRETQKAGERLAKKIIKSPASGRAFIIGLEGDLGGGKTTFLQGFARGLGVGEKVNSPTFVIMKKYKIKKNGPEKNKKIRLENFYHIDCYRINKPKEILELGFKDAASDPKNIIALEWANLIRKIVPRDSLWITFKFITSPGKSPGLSPEMRRRRYIVIRGGRYK